MFGTDDLYKFCGLIPRGLHHLGYHYSPEIKNNGECFIRISNKALDEDIILPFDELNGWIEKTIDVHRQELEKGQLILDKYKRRKGCLHGHSFFGTDCSIKGIKDGECLFCKLSSSFELPLPDYNDVSFDEEVISKYHLDLGRDEIWKPVEKYKLLCSSYGRIAIWCKKTQRWKVKIGIESEKGYYKISLGNYNKPISVFVHRLICEAFNGSPLDRFCLHKYDHKFCNFPSYLSWGSAADNRKQFLKNRSTIVRKRKDFCFENNGSEYELSQYFPEFPSGCYYFCPNAKLFDLKENCYVKNSFGDVIIGYVIIRKKGLDKFLFINGRSGYSEASLRTKAGKEIKVTLQRIFCFIANGQCPDEKMFACHKNGIKCDNRLENLYWGDGEDQYNDMKRHGTTNRSRGTNNDSGICDEKTKREIVAAFCLFSDKAGIMTALSEFYKIGNTSIERVIEGTPYVLVELSHELRFILENLPKKRTRLSDSDVLYIRENPDNITIEEMSEKLSITRKHLLRIRKGQQRAA